MPNFCFFVSLLALKWIAKLWLLLYTKMSFTFNTIFICCTKCCPLIIINLNCSVLFQIPATITRILLNHFKWDKEKLMERYYDADQDKLFKEAHVINPINKPNLICKPKVGTPLSVQQSHFNKQLTIFLPLQIKKSGTEECDICFSHFPPTVSTFSNY
jgi:hypothetical protein